MEKIALVTGASSGIGKAVSKRLIDDGVHIIAVGRNISKLEELDDYARSKDSKITAVPLDLKDSEKILELAKFIQEKFGKLDILIANAAMLGEVTPLNHYDPKMWELVMRVNFTANWYLIRYLTHLLQRPAKANAIFVTCEMSSKNKAYWGAYGASKAALARLAETYAQEMASTNVKVSLLDPGAVDTKLRKSAFPGLDTSQLTKPDAVAELFLAAIEGEGVVNSEFYLTHNSQSPTRTKSSQNAP